MRNGKKRKKPMKFKTNPEQLGQTLRAAVYQSEAESHRVADSRDATPEEKREFVQVCRLICPRFQISEDMKPLLNDIHRWCLMLDGKHDPNKGLWLWGNIGTGKSTMLEIIREYCNRVRPHQRYRQSDSAAVKQLRKDSWPYSFKITNASFVAGAFARDGYPGIEEYILACRQAFDEVGRECIPTGYYGNMENVFQYIFQRRYDIRHGDFTHVTSNLNPEQIGEVYGDHIYDRCHEMFNFVEMSGASWR